jgi:hypothetical protein
MNIKKLAIVLLTVTALSGSVPAWEHDSSPSVSSSGYAEPAVELRHEIHHAVPAIERNATAADTRLQMSAIAEENRAAECVWKRFRFSGKTADRPHQRARASHKSNLPP